MMNRRGFLRLLAMVPAAYRIPHLLPPGEKLFGDGTDGDLVLTPNMTLAPHLWKSYENIDLCGFTFTHAKSVITENGELKLDQ
jgi:hypothetical protein